MIKNGVMFQYFEWYLDDDASLYKKIISNASSLKEAGFTALWLPPAYKGQAGIHDVGYGAYDLYDLGEFDQKGSIATKYGTKDEYLKAIEELHKYNIDVYADMVFNHKMGADSTELVEVDVLDNNNRNITIENDKMIEAWTVFNYPKRNNKYSSFKWNKSHFTGVDYDNRKERSAIYKISDTWNSDVDNEKGNYDYLMGADVNFENPEVIKELYNYGKWYLETTNVDGFRLDALKHIDSYFFKDWLKYLREYSQKELFTVGEYWSSDINTLTSYLDENDNSFSLFDVPLHFNFFKACNDSGYFDMGSIFNNTLVGRRSTKACTFVENHDTQAGQALQTIVTDWFKPLAYAMILLRNEGYPCVFYGDYYGIKKTNSRSFRKEIDQMLKIRHSKMIGKRNDYFDHFDIIGWTFEGNEDPKSGFAVILSDGPGGEKKMYIGKTHTGQTYVDITNQIGEKVIIDSDGMGLFKVNGGSYHIYCAL